MLKKSIVLILCVFYFFDLKAQSCNLKKFPKGFTPLEVGDKLCQRFIPAKHFWYSKWIHYAEVCTWYGGLRYAQVANKTEIVSKLKERYEPFFGLEKQYLPPMNHVDFNMLGCLPLELYKITSEERYKEIGMRYADSQWIVPDTSTIEQRSWADKGYTWQTRLWIDDMFMITVIQSQAYRITGDRKYIDRAAHEMVFYLEELQKDNGLFYHAPDAPFFWGRGNGWMAAGMAELLKMLPKDNPNHSRILKGYRKMMASLVKYQQPSGMWNQLIDHQNFWPETSSTAMFTYAMIVGVKQGWLEKKIYGKAARKGWMALIPYIKENGDVTEVCVGTNKSNDKEYYYNRPRAVGDFHGQAPVLWCAYALLEK